MSKPSLNIPPRDELRARYFALRDRGMRQIDAFAVIAGEVGCSPNTIRKYVTHQKHQTYRVRADSAKVHERGDNGLLCPDDIAWPDLSHCNLRIRW